MIRDAVHAVVLAAGAGARFGGSKLTAPFRSGVLLDGALAAACAAPVESVLVVTGEHAVAVEGAVASFAPKCGPTLRVVHCPDHAEGMSASLRCGLTTLPRDARGAFIFLGDMPHVPPSAAEALLPRLLGGGQAAVPAVNGRWGHPVLISSALFPSFGTGSGDGGGRANLRRLGKDLAVVEVNDDGIVRDADTPAELAKLSQLTRSHKTERC